MSNKKRIAKKIQRLNNRDCPAGNWKHTVVFSTKLVNDATHMADAISYLLNGLKVLSLKTVRETQVYQSYQYGIDFGSSNNMKPAVPAEYQDDLAGLQAANFSEDEAVELLKETFKF